MKLATNLLFIIMIDALYGGHVESRKKDNPKEIKNDEFASLSSVGTWSKKRYCSYGEYAVGFQLKVQEHQGWGYDDTAANSFRLLCAPHKTLSGMSPVDAPSESIGAYGSWSSPVTCKDGAHVVAFKTKAEENAGWGSGTDLHHDDTGLNSVHMKCSDGTIIEPTNEGKWGVWSGWTYCSGDRFICGFRQKGETSSRWDMHGLTALRMSCCDSTIKFKDRKGKWKQLNIDGATITFTESRIISDSITDANSQSYTTSLSLAVKAGYKFAETVSGEITVTGSEASTAARSISRTSTKSIGHSLGHSCGLKYFYQFIIKAEEETGSHKGGTIEWKSPYFVCTDTRHPRCPGGTCIDADCQKCFTNDGYREIKSAVEGNYCIRSIGSVVLLNKCDKKNTQKWHLAAASDVAGKFVIRSYEKKGVAEKCLAVDKKDYANEVDGGKVEVVECKKTPEQKWDYQKGQIKSSNQKCLVGWTGSHVKVSKCNGKSNQKWKIVAYKNSWDETFGFNGIFVYVIGCIAILFILCFIAGCGVGFFVFDNNSPIKQIM